MQDIASAAESDLLESVAELFYLRNQTQVEVAHSLGLHPSTVSRYLKRAREEGIVEIRINRRRQVHEDLARALAQRFSLRRAIVATGDPEAPLRQVARVAADYASGLLSNGMKFSISWGSTLLEVVRALRPGVVEKLDLGQLMGGVGYASPGIQGHELLRQLGSLYPDARVHYLHAPAIVDSPSVRDALVSDGSVSAALKAAARSHLALVGIGTVGEDSPLIHYGHLKSRDRKRIVAKGAVGDVCARFFTADGIPVDDELQERTIALDLRQLAAIPTVVAVACGVHKRSAILGAINTRCIDVLITDDKTALALLDEAQGPT